MNNTLEKKQDLENCTFIKTMLMLVIVLYHSIIFWQGNWFNIERPEYQSPVLNILSQWLASFHVYGFTLVSGYLFYNLRVEENRYTQFFSFSVKKGKRLLVPFAFTALVWVIPITQYFYHYKPSEIVYKYLLGANPSQLWFLLMLFHIFMIFWLFTSFFKNHNAKGFIIVMAVYCAGTAGQLAFPNIFCVWTACRYMIFFWTGFKLRQYEIDIISKVPWFVYPAINILFFGAHLYCAGRSGFGYKIISGAVKFVMYISGAFMSFFVLREIAGCVNWKTNGLFQVLAKYSMPVYLFHQQIIYVAIYYLNGAVIPSVNAAINFAAALIVSLIISGFLWQFKWTRFLLGGGINYLDCLSILGRMCRTSAMMIRKVSCFYGPLHMEWIK